MSAACNLDEARFFDSETGEWGYAVVCVADHECDTWREMFRVSASQAARQTAAAVLARPAPSQATADAHLDVLRDLAEQLKANRDALAQLLDRYVAAVNCNSLAVAGLAEAAFHAQSVLAAGSSTGSEGET